MTKIYVLSNICNSTQTQSLLLKPLPIKRSYQELQTKANPNCAYLAAFVVAAQIPKESFLVGCGRGPTEFFKVGPGGGREHKIHAQIQGQPSKMRPCQRVVRCIKIILTLFNFLFHFVFSHFICMISIGNNVSLPLVLPLIFHDCFNYGQLDINKFQMHLFEKRKKEENLH